MAHVAPPEVNGLTLLDFALLVHGVDAYLAASQPGKG